MFILHIDSSSDLCSVALGREGEEIGFEINSEPFSHGRDLNLMIDLLFQKSGLTMRELGAVSINRGPGSFTALRIGMAAAKGICFGLNIPLLTPDGMQILVDWGTRLFPDYKYYIPMIDARRMEVYTIDPVSNTETDFHYYSKVLDRDSYENLQNKKVCFLGNGVSKWESMISENPCWKFEAVETDARKMISISEDFRKKNNFSDLFHANPIYIKKPNITQSKKQYF